MLIAPLDCLLPSDSDVPIAVRRTGYIILQFACQQLAVVCLVMLW